jgi:hypothetical protein
VAGLESEHAGQFERILPHQRFDRIHHPGNIAHAADNLGVREKLRQRGQLGAPRAVGVEHQLLLVDRVVVAGEKAAQHMTALVVFDEDRRFAAPAHRTFERHVHRAHRARHAGMEARVLPQDRREQR